MQHSKLATVLEADVHQKLVLKFTILDKQAKKPMRCHQAFVRLEHKETGKELIFLAETDSTLVYKLDMVGPRYVTGAVAGDPAVAVDHGWWCADVPEYYRHLSCLFMEYEL